MQDRARQLQQSFNPRSPRGGATICARLRHNAAGGFNPRSPRGGATKRRRGYVRHESCFNPRSPRGGATDLVVRAISDYKAFQSTLPTRGSDISVKERRIKKEVSIHAPHEGERRSGSTQKPRGACFNPRSPRGGATIHAHVSHFALGVSIHAPHEGERRRKSAFVCSISANLLNIIHCGTVTRAVSRRRIALFRLFSVRRSGVFMYAYASH